MPRVVSSYFRSLRSDFICLYTFNSLIAVWVKGQRSSTPKGLVVGFVAGVANVLRTTLLWVLTNQTEAARGKISE